MAIRKKCKNEDRENISFETVDDICEFMVRKQKLNIDMEVIY